MPITWSESIAQLDWLELESLYRAAPLGDKSAKELETVFSNSRFRCFAYEDGRLVAAGRALADGADASYICDVAVLPSHQGSGLGKEVVQRLVELSAGHKKIILYSVPGKEGFYRKLGFYRMLTAMAIFDNPAKALARGHISDLALTRSAHRAKHLNCPLPCSSSDKPSSRLSMTLSHPSSVSTSAAPA